ncbi:MAG TPA: CRISPR-associated helicase Cas3', partial [Hyphomicrobiales bacterium]|nr:CRISPR-associated helicase Cas3' [Hyphomicrobiales bacterium]
MASFDFISRYWGKAQPIAESDYPRSHPAAYHCLDVAAAARCILDARPLLLQRISSLSGMPAEAVTRWLLFAACLHDLGKFADCFQCKAAEEGLWAEENWAVWKARGAGPKPLRHGEAGWCLWREAACAGMAEALNWDRETEYAFECWLRPVFGHHGKPIPDDDNSRASEIATKKAIADSREFALAAANLFRVEEGRLEGSAFNEHGMHRAGWLVSGLSVMADWIGSNQEWFPYTDPHLNLEAYWRHAQERAAKAIEAAGLAPISVAQTYGLVQALNFKDAAATPLQEWAAAVELPAKGPALAFLEDLTGSGKTEAALILAHRLMAQGHARGLYWALPTQATANALYGRLRKSYRNLFGDGGAIPSLALAHSSTDLQNDFKQSIFNECLKEDTGRPEEQAYDPADEQTASALCAEWLASDRRRCLLADVGVGTVDQALLGALPVKFQSLRLAALAERVLIIDEAHSYDKFTTGLLKQTLAFQAALGGSAIVLSATLTNDVKNELLSAFAEGAGWVRKNYCEKAASSTHAFPLASLLTAPPSPRSFAPKEAALQASRGTRRDRAVARLDDATEAIRSLIAHARAGRCAVWIRNTVQDAIDGAEALKVAAPELEPWLFHARFTLADRA